ncbi:MAG TPA: isoprenylcysteine carboxylmethyltransferase family protein [Acetobacteraceae bacterium]|jgi:protein-S-isoprenylcysteine O-methyltransferase Ste14|nr:isoprenylcysteine carboxylmethyltransferase family protein [Acetobacteraceae bacterium]
MQLFYRYSITALWVAFGVFWLAAAVSGKATRRRETIGSRISHMLPLMLAVILLSSSQLAGRYLVILVLPHNLVTFWLGFALVLAGIAVSISARVSLGGNWSGIVTLKQDHELIRKGPYRLVRHPIYTGLLAAILGTAIAQGEVRSILAVALVAAAFVHKIGIEEAFLTQEFGDAYTRYRREVPALIPFLRPR